MAFYKVVKEVVIDGVTHAVDTRVSLEDSQAKVLVSEGKIEEVK